MKTPQFHFTEFLRLLERVASGRDGFYHCLPSTVDTIGRILSSDYPEREDDIEYLMDMVNYEMRSSGYAGQKSRFPASRHLDRICSGPLYVDTR